MSAFAEWIDDSILLKTDAVPVALNETLQLVFVPFVFVVLFGIPLGVLLYATSRAGCLRCAGSTAPSASSST